ncbi:VOC family protein [Floricoccus tropicus]|uniref:VOC family protein n=1 Tax=Floricoccus tropicus TaxID=1859473 RepID=UPI0009F6BC97|nr:VOC family protein [Floricoccus tropicus]
MVEIITDDIEEALKFYKLLGFSILLRDTKDCIFLNNKGVKLSLSTKIYNESIYGTIPRSSGNKVDLAFLCDSAQDVDDLCHKFTNAGVEIFQKPITNKLGERFAMIQDPDGNLLRIYA